MIPTREGPVPVMTVPEGPVLVVYALPSEPPFPAEDALVPVLAVDAPRYEGPVLAAGKLPFEGPAPTANTPLP